MTTEERRNELEKLIMRRQGETLESIANKLGVSKRTVQRDIEAISRILPVYVSAGRNGGVFVCDTYRVSRIYMTSSELQVLSKVINIAETHPHVMERADRHVLHEVIKDYTRPVETRKDP